MFKGRLPSNIWLTTIVCKCDDVGYSLRPNRGIIACSANHDEPIQGFDDAGIFLPAPSILTRLRRSFSGIPPSDRVTLPWGDVIVVRPHEPSGHLVLRHF